MRVFVMNMRGEPLMPTTQRKARLLLKADRARIYQYEPFTIQLKYGCGETKQDVSIGVDTGAKNIGIAIAANDEVIAKGTIELRDDVKGLLETRRACRRGRRSRNLRYRKSRWQYRPKPQEWLPPSIQSRVDNTMNWIDKFLKLVPNPKLIIEVGKFDIQKIEHPEIEGEGYQQGKMYQYRNRIAYLLARENGICQYCKSKKETGNEWRLHHIWGKERDRSEDWALLHESCHIEIHAKHEEASLQKKKSKSYKESTFMNIIRNHLFERYPKARFTYGNITFQDRCDLGLKKTHYNDAIAITGTKKIKKNPSENFYIRQSRIKKRSLHEATARKGGKEPNRESKRNAKNTSYKFGLHLNDRVEVYGIKGFVSGFDSGSVYVKNYDGDYIKKESKSYKQIPKKDIKFISHTRGWQYIASYTVG